MAFAPAGKKGTDRERVRKSLRYSVADGSFYSSMVGFGESFIQAFAVFLKATNFQLSLLGSLPQTLGCISQFFSSWLIRFADSTVSPNTSE